MGAAEHCHRGACRNGFAEANAHTGHRRFRGGLTHCLHQKRGFHSEKRGIIAKDAGNVGAAVVGNGNIQGTGGSANIVADRHCLDRRAVAAFFLAGGNADAGSLHLHAGGVQDGAVLCTQPCVAHADAHRDSTRVRAAENRLRMRIHFRIHINGCCDNILAENACHCVGIVKAQEHIRAYAHDAAVRAEDQGSSAAGYIILNLNNRVFRVNLAGAGACLFRIRSQADVGIDLGAHNGDRARNAYARDTSRDTGEPCVGLGIGGAGYRELGKCAVDGNVLAHIGVGLNAALDDGHTRVDCRHAAGNRDGNSRGFGVGIGFDLNGLDAADADVPRDMGFYLAFMVNDRKEAVDRSHAAGACAGDAEDAGIVAVGGYKQSGGLAHIAVQVGNGVVAQDNDAAGHGHTCHAAGTHNRDGADGAGAEIQLIAAIIVLNKTGDCVVPLLLAAVAALLLFHGAGVGPDVNLAVCAERSVLVHAGDDIAVRHVHSQRRTNTCDAACKRGCHHIGADQLIRKHLDVAARRNADAAADHRADRALGIVLGCSNRRSFAQIRIVLFVYFKVFAAICVVGGCLFVRIEVLADVSAFGIEIAVIAAKLNIGLPDAVAFQLARQTIHPVALGVAAGEGIADKAIRVKAALGILPVFFLFIFTQGIILFLREAVSAHEQSVGGILRQLAACNGYHDGGADARPGAGCRGARVAEHIPFRIGKDVHAAIDYNIVLPCLAADHAGGNGVVQHTDNCRHAHRCGAAECPGSRNCEDLGIIQRGDIQLFRGNGHVLLRLGTGDLIGDEDIHRSGDRCRAADADARRVGSDKFLGIRRQGHIAACPDHRAFAKFRHGAAVKPGNHCHRGDRRGAAARNGCRHVEQIGAALRGHVHIPGSSHASAEGGKQIVLKGQGACAHAHGRGAAAREAERQQIHIVGGLRRCPDAAACAQLSADTHACLHVLVINHGHNRGAYTRAAAGRDSARKVIYVCFVGAFYGSLRIVAGCFLGILLAEACLYDAVVAYSGLDDVFEYQRIDNAADSGGSDTRSAADGCHQHLGVRVGADNYASAFLAAVGKPHAAIAHSGRSQGHVVSNGGANLVLHNHSGNRCAHAHAAAAERHVARCVIDTNLRIAGNGNAVTGIDHTVVTDLGDELGLRDHNGDSSRNRGAAGRGACHSHQNGLVFPAGKHIDIASRRKAGGFQRYTAADSCGHGLLKHAHVDRRAHRGAASAGCKARHGDNLLDIALGKHVDRAGLRFDDGTIAHGCLGIALADQNTDNARLACLGARAGGGGQNIDQVFFAFRLNRHVLCRRDDRIRSRFGKSGVSGDDGRNGAACRRSIARHIHGGGDEDQIGKVLGENADAAICGGKACAITHGRAYFIPGDDHVHRAADGSGLRTDTRAAEDAGHGDRKNIVLCFGADADVIRGSDRRTAAHACIDLAPVVKARNVHANACSAGAGERAADHTAVHAAYRFHRCFAAVKDNDCAIGDSGGGITSGKEHGERACRRCLRIRSHGNSARNGLHIIVHGCQIVQHIHGTHDHLGAEIHLNAVVLLVAVGILLAVADIEMDEALVVGAGLIHASVRNGKEILEVEGELVVISGNRLLFRRDFQAAGGDGCALADFGEIDVLVIDQREGSADAHAGAASGDAAGSDRDFGLFHGAHHHVAAVHHGAVQDPGAALSVGLDHGHGARKAHGISLAAHCACQRLGCQKARELAVQILSENSIGRDAAFGAEIAGKRSVRLIVVDTDGHAHGEHIGIDQGVERLRNACAGSIGAVVRAVFRPGVNVLREEAAADQGLGLMGSNIDTHSRGNIHRGAGEPGRILSGSTGFLQRLVCGVVGHSGTGGKIQAQHAHHHGHQGAAANAVCNRTIARCGDLVELPHNHAVYDAGRGVIGEVRDAESRSDFLEIAVKACAVGQGKCLGLILVQSFRINNNTASYLSLPVKLRIHIGSGEIDGNGSSHRNSIAGGKAGGGSVGLTALTGAQVKVRLLIDIFALFVCGNSCGADDIPAAERQARALIDRRSDCVVHKIERHGGIHCDVLGAGLVRGQSLSDGRSLIVGERLLSADGILTGNGNRVNVVVNNGLGAERAGGNDSVLTNARLCRCVHVGHSKGRTHAYTLA